jgi:hypothetical protein
VVASLVLSASGLDDDKLVKLGNLKSLPIEPNEKGPLENPNENGFSGGESPVSGIIPTEAAGGFFKPPVFGVPKVKSEGKEKLVEILLVPNKNG